MDKILNCHKLNFIDGLHIKLNSYVNRIYIYIYINVSINYVIYFHQQYYILNNL